MARSIWSKTLQSKTTTTTTDFSYLVLLNSRKIGNLVVTSNFFPFLVRWFVYSLVYIVDRVRRQSSHCLRAFVGKPVILNFDNNQIKLLTHETKNYYFCFVLAPFIGRHAPMLTKLLKNVGSQQIFVFSSFVILYFCFVCLGERWSKVVHGCATYRANCRHLGE